MYQNTAYNQGGYGAPSPPQPQQQHYHQQPPPPYGGGYYDQNSMPQQQQQQQQQGGYNQNQNPPGGGGYNHGAPSPVNSAYQRANAAMTRGSSPLTTNASAAVSNHAGGGSGPPPLAASTTGLIRLTLRKPMGIVFEPMTDPHNPSQQRGVRICDLPRTGAAAMSLKLEVGDELLSINDKTMSRLTFDEIMDFIIEADKERVDLLFRRPGRAKESKGVPAVNANAVGVNAPGNLISPMGLGGIGSNGSNSVKWIDEKSNMEGKLSEKVKESDKDAGGGRGGNNAASGTRGRDSNKNNARDEPSVDDTYNDGYTVESQSQYTTETYEEDTGRSSNQRRGRGGRYEEDDPSKQDKHSRGDGGRGHRNSHHHNPSSNFKRKNDPVESSGFLDLLIDTLCTSVMGRDARDMCGDRSDDKGGPNMGNMNQPMKNKYGDEDEFTVDDGTYNPDDGTYTTNEGYNDAHRSGNNRGGGHHKDPYGDEDEFTMEDEEGTFITAEDDGTRTLESKDVLPSTSKKSNKEDKKKGSSKDYLGRKASLSSKSKSKDALDNKLGNAMNDQMMGNTQEMNDPYYQARANDPMPSFQNTAPDPPPADNLPLQQMQQALKQQQQQQNNFPQQQQANQQQFDPVIVNHRMNQAESAIASGIALPVKELEYDIHGDYAADVSVMESLGGPSLLVERARHENAVNSGADRAAYYENLDRQDPELASLVAQHGEGFRPDSGMTKEETAFRDPYKFYEFAVCALLRENEPEKVRLLSKLMAKYRGRERHLINKLSARYDKDNAENGGGGGNAKHDGNAGGATGNAGNNGGGSNNNADQVASAPSVERNASGVTGANGENNMSQLGMEKIHEGDDEEEGGSSHLNDPSRANMAAIESAKKKMESSAQAAANAATAGDAAQDTGIATKKSPNDVDGWPPAMSDPWGTSKVPSMGSGGEANIQISNNGEDEGALRPIGGGMDHHDDDEGSYSDGSSYTGDDSGDEVDGTSPAIIAQVSELLNYVYGKTSVAGQIDRVSTIMRAYEGREAVLLELLETKALIKANADSNRGGDSAELPISLRNSPGLETGGSTKPAAGGDAGHNDANESSKKLTPQTPISVLTAPTIVEYPATSYGPGDLLSPATLNSPENGNPLSPGSVTLNTLNTTASKKKKKGIFKGFFGGKKNRGKGDSSSIADQSTMQSISSPKKKKMSKKGQPLHNEDDRSI